VKSTSMIVTAPGVDLVACPWSGWSRPSAAQASGTKALRSCPVAAEEAFR
jgi:hypothetical protein